MGYDNNNNKSSVASLRKYVVVIELLLFMPLFVLLFMVVDSYIRSFLHIPNKVLVVVSTLIIPDLLVPP